MKKVFYFAFVALFSVALASCNSKKSDATAESSEATESTESTETAASDASDAFKPSTDAEKQIVELGMAAFKAMFEGGDLAQYTEPGTSEEVKANINKMNKENYERDHNEFGMVVKNARVTKVEVTPEIGGGGVTITYDKEYTKVEGAEPSSDICPLALKEVDGKYYIFSETLNQ